VVRGGDNVHEPAGVDRAERRGQQQPGQVPEGENETGTRISLYTILSLQMFYGVWHTKGGSRPDAWERKQNGHENKPLNDIVITNVVWCMAYKGRVEARCLKKKKKRTRK